ncbi:MAG: cytochrome b/b6 domain-containing protein [Novosphingobium sp.]|nr:cytochrome b/b6 domain-containing protein [Novosphingobium sp.]MCP5403837.1 cytochrome b/b6 domain-containing protein [Novosphingobium sp.]
MTASNPAKVWDAPTRLFHWLIALLVFVSWRSAESGAMDWHYISGVSALALLLFRLVWGLIGGSTARFSHFVRSPSAALDYLRDPAQVKGSPGHNPLGGYSVIAMLLSLAIQIGTGLFSVDVDGIESGPLSYLVTFDQGRTAAEIHELSFNILLGLIILHVLAIAYYRIRHGRKLILPMITGRDAQIPAGEEQLTSVRPIRFLLATTFAAGVAWWVNNGLTY